MLHCFLLLLLWHLSLAAATPDQWIPARWPFPDPASLDLLTGSPINCLLVPPGGSSGPVGREARRRGIALLVESAPGVLSADGAVTIPLAPRDRLLRDPGPTLVAVSDSLWPRVKPQAGSAGPTGDPWLDSNLWRVRSLAPRAVWLAHLPDKPLPEDYPRAVADAALAGGRWIIALDDDLRSRLARRDPQALATWSRTVEHLKFFEEHSGWQRFSPRARLGVIQDPAGKNAFLSGEVQNLLTRRQMPYRVIDRTRLSESAIENLAALIAQDLDSPTPEEQRILTAFGARGRMLVSASKADPYALSLDVLTRMGRNNQGIRLFNVSSILAYLSADPAGKAVLVQVVNYAGSPVERITARLSGDFRQARLYLPGAPPAGLPLDRSGGSVEFTIPQVSIYAAVLLR